MKTFSSLTKRNVKLFFKDKSMFFVSLITPLILLVLYATFLAKVYRDSFVSAMPDGFSVPASLINATVGGELISSLLAVSCVTVAFCSNLLMVNDKVNGARKDFAVTPVKKSTLAFSYYVSSLLTTLIITYTATFAGFGYLAITGWYMSVGDVFLLILDVFLLTMFGVAFSSVVNFLLSTNGQASAVGTIVSSVYGFICGAYMPISNFGKGLQHILSFLPGTYGTSLVRNHTLAGVFAEMQSQGFPPEVVKGIKDSIDSNLYFFDHPVSITAMYLILCLSILALLGIFILENFLKRKAK